MAVDIGPKIGIQGETEFRKELEKVSQGVKTLGSEMKIVTAEFSNNAKSEEALTQKNDVLERSVLALKEKLDLQNEALLYAGQNYKENSKETLVWQQAVNETRAAIAKAESQIEKNNATLKEMGKDEDEAGKKGSKMGELIKSAAGVVKGGFQDAAAAVKPFINAVEQVGKVAFAAAATGAAAIGSAAVTAGVAIASMAKETALIGDEIDKNSQKVGLSTEAYQKWDYAMKIAGTEMSSATTGLKTLTNKFDDAKNGSKGAIETFERLGLSMDEISNLSREELFETTVKALQNVTDETDKAALANDLFGKSGQDLMPMFNMTEEELDGLMNKAEEYGMVMSDEAVKSSAAFKDSLTTLQGTFQGFKNGLVEDLLPALTMVTDGLSALMIGDEDAGAQIAEGFSQIIEQITAKLPELSNLFALIVGVVAEQAPAILQALVNGIMTALPTLIPVATSAIMTLTQALVAMAPDLLKAGMDLIVSLVNGLANALPDLIPVAIDAIITIVDALIDNIDKLIDAAIAITLALANGLIEALPKLLEKAPEIIQKLVTAIINNVGKLVEAAFQIVGKLVSGIVENLPQIGKAAGDIIATLLKGLADSFVKFIEIGQNIIQGIWNGIKNKGEWLLNQVKGFINGLVGGVKKLLGISSPSRVFAEIGGYMAEGLGEGWEKEFGAVQRDINGSMESLLPTSTANIGVVSSMRGTGMQSSVADAVNAMGTLMSSNGNGGDLAIQFIINGREFARGILPDFRLVSAQNPIIVNDF